jgi:hypothetical protein
MNAKSLVTLILLAAAALASTGCASLSKSECLSANWEDIGVRDGANGRAEEYLIQHSKACSKVQVTPDREAWLDGRTRGLERFCVPYRVYQIGEYGAGFDVGICRGYDEDRLLSAHQKGLDVYRLGNAVASLDSEIRGIRVALDQKELEPKERDRLVYRLAQIEYERHDAVNAYERARWRARDL